MGSGLGTTIVAAWFKRRFDTQLETHKALLQRSGQIHERQVDALLTLHSRLEHALFNLQRAAGHGKLAGEADDHELLNRMGRDLGEAAEEYSRNKLLIGDALGRKVDEFFNKMTFAGIDLNLAMSPMVQDGDPRAKLWGKAQDGAFKELPLVLEAIRTEARAVIHG